MFPNLLRFAGARGDDRAFVVDLIQSRGDGREVNRLILPLRPVWINLDGISNAYAVDLTSQRRKPIGWGAYPSDPIHIDARPDGPGVGQVDRLAELHRRKEAAVYDCLKCDGHTG